ncbi:hypothetical protein ANN_21661 [Periplaneta americana]|uniref:Uncharacterized protein n=1 Tax=Periplaneta americana TaxID=6978 RepID=A0ABQ8S624_PERAM|nr:hypothetical protein ANN_21661 [Periplaneta americana]
MLVIVIKMLVIVVALFALCWLPLQTYNVLQYVYPEINQSPPTVPCLIEAGGCNEEGCKIHVCSQNSNMRYKSVRPVYVIDVYKLTPSNGPKERSRRARYLTVASDNLSAIEFRPSDFFFNIDEDNQGRRIHYQQDWVLPHYRFELLDRLFPGRWIGRTGPTAWPPRSPDFTPCIFSFEDSSKIVFVPPSSVHLAELRNRFNFVDAEVTLDLLAHVWQYVGCLSYHKR